MSGDMISRHRGYLDIGPVTLTYSSFTSYISPQLHILFFSLLLFKSEVLCYMMEVYAKQKSINEVRSCRALYFDASYFMN